MGETQASRPPRGRRTLLNRRRALGAAVALVVSASPVATFATDNVWTGAVDNNYNNPGNWSLGRVPVKPNGEAPPADGYDDAQERG